MLHYNVCGTLYLKKKKTCSVNMDLEEHNFSFDNIYLGYSALINKCWKQGEIYKKTRVAHLQDHYCDMMTVPWEQQLPHITHYCCPGIGPQGGGEGSQWRAGDPYEGGHGRGRNEVSACIGRKGVEEAYQLESSWAWHFWWIILLLLQLDVDHNLLLLLLDQLLPLLHSIMNYSYTNTVSFPGKPEVTKGWWQFWWLLVAVSQTRRTINTSVLAANYGATRHLEQYTEHLDNAVTQRR